MDQVKAKRLLAKRKKKVAGTVILDPLFVKQNAFVNSTQRFIAAQCSRRAGKSSGLALRFFNTMAKYPKSTCIYLSLTFDSAKSIMWPVLQFLNDKYHIGCTFLEGKMVMTHPNGAKLRLYGADQKNFIKRLKGQKSPGIAIDEAQDFSSHLQTLIDDVLTPMLVDYPESWLAITGTPGPVPHGYYFEITNKGLHGFDTHSWTLLDNPYIPEPQVFIDDLVQKKQWEQDNPTLLREWRNNWVLDVKALWIQYKQDLNDYNELPTHIREWHYILGVDVGWVDADACAVIAWSHETPNVYLAEELIMPKQTISALIDQIKFLDKKYHFHTMVMDAGALGKKIQEEMRQRHGLMIDAAEKERKQENVEFLNDAMRLGIFKAKAMSRFAQDSYLVQVDWDKSTPDRMVVKQKPHSDIIDAVLYAYKVSPAYNYQPPAVRPQPGTPEFIKEQEEKHLQSMIEQVQHQNNLKQGKSNYGWIKKGGDFDWNKWNIIFFIGLNLWNLHW